jgi:hypothetical protein
VITECRHLGHDHLVVEDGFLARLDVKAAVVALAACALAVRARVAGIDAALARRVALVDSRLVDEVLSQVLPLRYAELAAADLLSLTFLDRGVLSAERSAAVLAVSNDLALALEQAVLDFADSSQADIHHASIIGQFTFTSRIVVTLCR